ncbi:MAG: low molecular weight phosphotyrosine protein phosphatase [Clostridia bacterium]|nr:low molecular weight phosphotyrosine protein phosphatase [Clostridia bacterium]MBR2418226.1 low molecular weight phosphotyrosine protein phosphatase [Clostridia bacterium]
MKRIMFVCHGNICRSPMAEFIFKKMLSEEKLTESFVVASSATSTEEIWGDVGNPVYPPAKKELLKHGITCDGKRAVQLKKSDYDKYDYFIAMDSMNVRNIMRIFGSDKEGKVSKLLDHTNEKGDVADPWYTGKFDVTYSDIEKGCRALLKELTDK